MLLFRLPWGSPALAPLDLDAWLPESGKASVARLLWKARKGLSNEQVLLLERLLGRRLSKGGVDEAA